MLRVLLILIIIAGLVGGLWRFSNLRSAPVTAELEQQLKQKSVALLQTEPMISTGEQQLPWKQFFMQSKLGSDGEKIPAEEWYLNHKPYIETRAGGGYRVSWIGLPGCEFKSEPQDLVELSDPQLFDAEGYRCFSWWRVKVLFNGDLQTEGVIIDELGGVEGSTG